ncbi:Tf2-11, partial [Mucuna pruriens]
MLETKLLGFEHLKELYLKDEFFKGIYELCTQVQIEVSIFMKNFSLRIKGCVCPKRTIGEKAFGEYKTYWTLCEHFFWPHMKRDFHHICDRCLVCKSSKSKVKPHNFYTPLPVHTILPRSKTGKDSIFVMVNRFSKMTHFIPCHKTNYACDVEVVILHGLPRIIVSNKDSKFLSHVWRILWSKLGTKLLFFTTYHPQTDGQTEIVNSIMSYTPFELVYGFNPLTPLDLLPFPNINSIINYDGVSKAQFVKELYAKIRSHVERKVKKGKVQKVFNEGDLVCVHLRKERFPNLRKFKLLPRGDGPFEVLKK